MSPEEFTDEMLVAFADGELDAATAKRIEDALEKDERLASRLEAFVATRDILKSRLGPLAREPVPEHLTRFVISDGASGPAARASAPGNRGGWNSFGNRAAWPIAASVAVVIAGVSGYWLGGLDRGAGMPGAVASLSAAEPALARVLGETPDGVKVAWRASAGGRAGDLSIRSSYRTRVGLCRSFAIVDQAAPMLGISGVSCREGDAWRVRVVAAAPVNGGDVFTPASGAAKPVEAFLDGVEAEDPLPAERVRELIGRNWR